MAEGHIKLKPLFSLAIAETRECVLSSIVCPHHVMWPRCRTLCPRNVAWAETFPKNKDFSHDKF